MGWPALLLFHSRYSRQVTPKIIHLYCTIIYLQDQSIPTKNSSFWQRNHGWPDRCFRCIYCSIEEGHLKHNETTLTMEYSHIKRKRCSVSTFSTDYQSVVFCIQENVLRLCMHENILWIKASSKYFNEHSEALKVVEWISDGYLLLVYPNVHAAQPMILFSK